MKIVLRLQLEGEKWVYNLNKLFKQGFFLAILGRGPWAFLIGKFSNVNPEFGKFSKYSQLIIFTNVTYHIKVFHLESLNNTM